MKSIRVAVAIALLSSASPALTGCNSVSRPETIRFSGTIETCPEGCVAITDGKATYEIHGWGCMIPEGCPSPVGAQATMDLEVTRGVPTTCMCGEVAQVKSVVSISYP